ncbi:MAG: glucose 1-dehydrogenase [Desulfobacterales bacterium]|jgi:NAD(P)-dependent dehydrogenase (short-subunit alcohol dehydrogenase family)|nr:glucose 1-dehydrogenase [Desulfobacterales bacterium]
MQLEGKVALVTGSGRGIGMGIAKRFAEEGALVVVNSLSRSGEAVAEEISRNGGKACFVQVDVSKEVDAQNAVQYAVSIYGRLDVLVNNAGVELIKPLVQITEEEWDNVMDINVKGYFLMSKYALMQMISQNRGNIINIASIAGIIAAPLLACYCASKGAIVQLTKAIALEYRDQNIQANVLCPGLIKTDLGDRFVDTYKAAGVPIDAILTQAQHRVGTLEDVASAAVFLATDSASFVNGVALPLDGGATAS